jgi:hypothetical protein
VTQIVYDAVAARRGERVETVMPLIYGTQLHTTRVAKKGPRLCAFLLMSPGSGVRGYRIDAGFFCASEVTQNWHDRYSELEGELK